MMYKSKIRSSYNSNCTNIWLWLRYLFTVYNFTLLTNKFYRDAGVQKV